MKKANHISVGIIILLAIVFTSCKKENSKGSTLNINQNKDISLTAQNVPIFIDKGEVEIL